MTRKILVWIAVFSLLVLFAGSLIASAKASTRASTGPGSDKILYGKLHYTCNDIEMAMEHAVVSAQNAAGTITTKSNTEGDYAIPLREGNIYTITVTFDDVVVATTTLEGGTERFDVDISWCPPPAIIRGRVRANCANEILDVLGATVEIQPGGQSAKTDASGLYDLGVRMEQSAYTVTITFNQQVISIPNVTKSPPWNFAIGGNGICIPMDEPAPPGSRVYIPFVVKP